jgi:hypothetical protein
MRGSEYLIGETLQEVVVVCSEVISRNLLVCSKDCFKNRYQHGRCSERGTTSLGTVSSVALANVSECVRVTCGNARGNYLTS